MANRSQERISLKQCRLKWVVAKALVGVAVSVVSALPLLAETSLFNPNCDSADQCFPTIQQDASGIFSRSGAAIYRFWGFRVYSAALYREKAGRGGDVFSKPFCLRLGYFREITGPQFEESSRSALKGEPQAALAAAEPNLKKLFAAMRTVGEGDVYQMCYQPTGDFILSLNSKEIWRITNKEFARLYLSIWLGDTSVHTSNRDKLLG
jgi:hypothetical protein